MDNLIQDVLCELNRLQKANDLLIEVYHSLQTHPDKCDTVLSKSLQDKLKKHFK